MKTLLIAVCLLLSACTAVPVEREFPKVPDGLMEAAPDLITLVMDKPKLSDLIENANDNYTEYYKLRDKYIGWQNWYKQQKEIFSSVK
jgi:hypothetical protein